MSLNLIRGNGDFLASLANLSATLLVCGGELVCNYSGVCVWCKQWVVKSGVRVWWRIGLMIITKILLSDIHFLECYVHNIFTINSK